MFAMFLPLQYNSVGNYLLILVFRYRIRMGCYRSHNKGSLYVYQFNSVEKQMEDKDICLRPVYEKIFKSKLKLLLPFHSGVEIPEAEVHNK